MGGITALKEYKNNFSDITEESKNYCSEILKVTVRLQAPLKSKGKIL